MYIFRWLMKHPVIILALYFLSIVAILFSMTSGGSSDKSTDLTESAEVQQAETSEVDATKEPSIEPSTLTSALVDGEAVKTDAESAETETEEASKETDTADTTKEEVKTSEVVETEQADAEAKTEESVTEKEADEPAVEANTEESTVEEVAKTDVATDTNNGSAAAYFKEHGVDTSLNKPVVVTESEEKSEEAAESEEVVTAETTEVVATDSSTDQAINAEGSQFSEMNADELLLMAREAYWNNGLEESAEIYQQLISASPDVFDYKGELGNVYWRQGFPKKAAELYAEISMPMIEAGDAEKVANMVGFIGLFYPEKATEIHNKLQAGK